VTASPHGKTLKNAESVAAFSDEESAVRDERFEEDCLRRDANRCQVTGNMEIREWDKLGRPNDIDILFAHTEGAHITPFAYGSFKDALVQHSQ
jgi:hypothetical protein